MKLYPVEAAPRGDNTINGAYRLLSKLAEGGMGEVFLAEQIAVQRHVALKMLRRDKLAGLDLKEATERFEREALAMSRLRHPNTVQLIDFGVDGASGSYYLVLELLSGKALNVLLAEQGALTPTRAARIGVQIARALEEAHRHGIVHRDLKPDNVLLCEFDGASDFVKVLDFGIAISPATPMSKRLTSRSEILGSPYYMSPEQVRAQIVSFPSDVFSMGVLLYEALSGVPPFEGPSVVETMYRRLDGPPAPLRLARASDVRLEAAWDGLVRQMLKIEPEERPTMSEVRARLEDLRLWVPGARAPLGVKPAPAPRLAPEPEDPEALLASGLLETEDDEQPRGPATGAAARPASVARPWPKRRPTRGRAAHR
ncbi:MAG: serine/threonine protein kinase [Deltaproteobacteria bacterium]|nr:serine/threonine protein kinase [Deltaproteobacteria bacterium]